MDMFVSFGLSPIARNVEPQFSCRPSLVTRFITRVRNRRLAELRQA
jgi:hypothetical protein